MINSTGIHSSGNEGLPQISPPPQEVDPQVEDQFKKLLEKQKPSVVDSRVEDQSKKMLEKQINTSNLDDSKGNHSGFPQNWLPATPSRLDELKSRYESAKQRLDEAEKGGNPLQILQARMEFFNAKSDWEKATNPNDAASREVPGGATRKRGPFDF